MTNYHWQSNNHKRSGVDDLVLLNQVTLAPSVLTIDGCSFMSFKSFLHIWIMSKVLIFFPELPIRGYYLI